MSSEMSAECDYDTRAAAAAPERVSTRTACTYDDSQKDALQDAANKEAREAVAAASAAGVAGAASETTPGETTVEVTLYETCNGQRGWTVHESTKRTRGTEAGEKRVCGVIAQHDETFSPVLVCYAPGDVPTPSSMQRLPAFFAHSLAIAQFPGKTGGEWKQVRQTFGEHGRRGVVHTVTLTFWGE